MVEASLHQQSKNVWLTVCEDSIASTDLLTVCREGAVIAPRINRLSATTVNILAGSGYLYGSEHPVSIREGDRLMIDPGRSYHFLGDMEALVRLTPGLHGAFLGEKLDRRARWVLKRLEYFKGVMEGTVNVEEAVRKHIIENIIDEVPKFVASRVPRPETATFTRPLCEPDK